jgi:colanic acid/amylovoran biosynthesis protein
MGGDPAMEPRLGAERPTFPLRKLLSQIRTKHMVKSSIPDLRASQTVELEAHEQTGFPCVILIGASYTTGNMGVDALLSGSIASVFHSYPNAEVVVLDYGREPRVFEVPVGERTVSVRMENIRFSKRLFLGNHIALLLGLALLIRLVPIRAFRDWIVDRNRALRTVCEADMVCSLAGGDSFSDIYGLRRLLYVSLPQLLALVLGKPLILLPQTLGPFRSRIARGMARRIMKSATTVFTRDQVGMEEAARLLGATPGHVRFSRDMAFALEPAAPEGGLPEWLTGRGDRPLVGVNVSGLLYMGGYSQDNMFGLKADYRKLMEAMITRFAL